MFFHPLSVTKWWDPPLQQYCKYSHFHNEIHGEIHPFGAGGFSLTKTSDLGVHDLAGSRIGEAKALVHKVRVLKKGKVPIPFRGMNDSQSGLQSGHFSGMYLANVQLHNHIISYIQIHIHDREEYGQQKSISLFFPIKSMDFICGIHMISIYFSAHHGDTRPPSWAWTQLQPAQGPRSRMETHYVWLH